MKVARVPVTCLALLALAAFAAPSRAQEAFPSRGVRIILPFAPGSILDSLTRIVADGLTRKWAQAVIVENVAGSSGNTGTERFSRAAPDGYTLLAAPPGPFTINRMLFREVGYDPAGFAPVTVMGAVPNVLVVRKDFPARTFEEFIDYVKKNPGKVTYASQGVGTTPYLVVKLLEARMGLEMTHVPYRGSSLAQTDIAAGHIDCFFDALSNALPAVQGGNARALAITDEKRSPVLPDIPTVASFVPGFRSVSWFALALPPGAPAQLVDRISRDAVEIVTTPANAAKLRDIGLSPVGTTPAETVKFIAEEDAVWSKLVRDIGLQPQ